MAETTFDLNISLIAVDCATHGLRVAVQKTADTFVKLLDTLDPLWAITPGEWPDNFILLNRYLRTGVKPPFLFND